MHEGKFYETQRYSRGLKRLDAWELHKNNLKAKKIKLHSHIFMKKRQGRKGPKRLTSSIEMFKYFVNHTSFHGVRYWLDPNIHVYERFLWILVDITCLISSLYIISVFYNNFQAKKTNISIEDLQFSINGLPFPSVIVCPSSRVDHSKIVKTVEKYLPGKSPDAVTTLENLLHNMSNMRFTQFQEVNFHANESIIEELKGVNLTEILLDVKPDCEDLFYNCRWLRKDRNCCDIFMIQKTYYGFCYALNVPASNRYSSESGSGLVFSMNSNSKEINHMFVIIDDVKKYPSKGVSLTFGRKYDVSVKVASTIATPEVLALEHDKNPPCRYKNGSYKYANCLTRCTERKFYKICECNPLFFFPYERWKPCLMYDLPCLIKASDGMLDTYDLLLLNETKNMRILCDCAPECEYLDYDNFYIEVPFDDKKISFDIHFFSRTSIRYKQDIVVNALDMLVQFGGIIGLFLGGSIITFAELIYCFTISMIHEIRKIFTRKKNNRGVGFLNNDKKLFPYAN